MESNIYKIVITFNTEVKNKRREILNNHKCATKDISIPILFK